MKIAKLGVPKLDFSNLKTVKEYKDWYGYSQKLENAIGLLREKIEGLENERDLNGLRKMKDEQKWIKTGGWNGGFYPKCKEFLKWEKACQSVGGTRRVAPVTKGDVSLRNWSTAYSRCPRWGHLAGRISKAERTGGKDWPEGYRKLADKIYHQTKHLFMDRVSGRWIHSLVVPVQGSG